MGYCLACNCREYVPRSPAAILREDGVWESLSGPGCAGKLLAAILQFNPRWLDR